MQTHTNQRDAFSISRRGRKVGSLTNDQREIQRKLRVLKHADKIGDVSKPCRYFGIGRASVYRWRKVYADKAEAGLPLNGSGKVH